MIESISLGEYSINAEVSLKRGSRLNVIISHGSNNDMNYSLISKLFNRLSKDYSVARFNFSYVDQGMERGEERNMREIEACIRRLGNKNIVLVGKSYGGALSAGIASTGRFGVRRVFVLGYPLHGWNDPDRLSDISPLRGLEDLITFIIGDSDPNCRLELFRSMLPGHSVEVIEDSDHSYRPVVGKRTLGENEDAVVALVSKGCEGIHTG